MKFLLTNIEIKLQSLEHPLSSVSPIALSFLNLKQQSSINDSFQNKKLDIENKLLFLKYELNNVKSFSELHIFLFNYNKLKKYYFLVEKIWDRVVDSINSKSEKLGPMLVGCETIAKISYHPIANLGYPHPPVICFLDKGLGPSILKFSMPLEDKKRNPAAFIKIVRNMLPSMSICPAIVHEVGHQVGFDTGWNDELKKLLYRKITQLTGNEDYGKLFSSFTSEILADFYSLHHTNFSAVLGLADTIISDPVHMHTISGSPHPFHSLRLLLGTSFCKMAFGNGPWVQYEIMLKKMFPKSKFANNYSFDVLENFEPHLIEICKFISKTKMKSFGGKSLYEIAPWKFYAPSVVDSILNEQKNDFVDSDPYTKVNPILFFSGLRTIFQNRKRNSIWITNKTKQWFSNQLD